jgi:hypothetical protein
VLAPRRSHSRATARATVDLPLPIGPLMMINGPATLLTTQGPSAKRSNHSIDLALLPSVALSARKKRK